MVAGLVPIAMPLVAGAAGNPARVGLVMAAFSLGGLSAPAWGTLADRYRLHRYLLTGGLIVLSAGVALFSLLQGQVARLALAFLVGVAAAASATVANLFVVEVHPEDEWDERIGWLQTCYGGGQVAGLLLAGLLGLAHAVAGLGVAAAIAAAAAVLGWLTTETPSFGLSRAPVLLHPVRHCETSMLSPQRLFHYPDRRAFSALRSTLRSPFGGFMLLWLISFGGAATVFSLYPLLMRQGFGLTPARSSTAFALAATLGLLLYSPAGSWAEARGPLRVLRAGLWTRLLAFAVLAVLGRSPGFVDRGVLAMGCFVLVVLAWSPLSVAGTALAAELSPTGKGAGLGVFNAVTAVAGVSGAAAAGWAASLWGYASIAAVALGGVAISLAWVIAAPPVPEGTLTAAGAADEEAG